LFRGEHQRPQVPVCPEIGCIGGGGRARPKKSRETSENAPPPRYPCVTQVASLADRSEKIPRSPGGASDHLSPGTACAAVSDSEEVPRIPSAARRTTCPRVPHAPPSPSRTPAAIAPLDTPAGKARAVASDAPRSGRVVARRRAEDLVDTDRLIGKGQCRYRALAEALDRGVTGARGLR